MDLTALVASFVLVAVAELGDKTQIAVIALSAKYGSALLVYLGVKLALYNHGSDSVMMVCQIL